MQILNRSLPIFIRSSSLCCVARQTCRIIGNEKNKNTIFEKAGHLLISRDRGTSDENAGLSLRMRDGWHLCHRWTTDWTSDILYVSWQLDNWGWEMRKRDQEENPDSSDHIHQHENTTIVSRHKPEDQIKSDQMLRPTLFYGAETWTITKSLLSRLDAFEMWVYRRVLKISWTEKITNEEVLRRMGTGREIVRQFKTRKLQYLGHLIRHNSTQLQLIKGKIEGRRSRGRPRNTWTTDITSTKGLKYYQLKKAAEDRKRWHGLVVNLA